MAKILIFPLARKLIREIDLPHKPVYGEVVISGA